MLNKESLRELFRLGLINNKDVNSYICITKIINKAIMDINYSQNNKNDLLLKGLDFKVLGNLIEKINRNELNIIDALEGIDDMEFGKILLENLFLSDELYNQMQHKKTHV